MTRRSGCDVVAKPPGTTRSLMPPPRRCCGPASTSSATACQARRVDSRSAEGRITLPLSASPIASATRPLDPAESPECGPWRPVRRESATLHIGSSAGRTGYRRRSVPCRRSGHHRGLRTDRPLVASQAEQRSPRRTPARDGPHPFLRTVTAKCRRFAFGIRTDRTTGMLTAWPCLTSLSDQTRPIPGLATVDNCGYAEARRSRRLPPWTPAPCLTGFWDRSCSRYRRGEARTVNDVAHRAARASPPHDCTSRRTA
jgi:hypothetical protein